jgi:hypothetical protein
VLLSTLLLTALASSPLMAMPVGDPLSEAGRVRLDLRGDSSASAETDMRCEESSGCGASWAHQSASVGLHFGLLRGVGVFGELGLQQDQVPAADYRGRSRIWAAGLKTALPVSRTLWLAASARLDVGEGESLLADDEPDPELSAHRVGTGALLGVWGDSSGALWLGAQSSWQWKHSLWPLGTRSDEVELFVPLSPELPVSGVLGFGLSSEPLGLPWRRTGRVSVGLEGRAGQELGASAWIGLAL